MVGPKGNLPAGQGRGGGGNGRGGGTQGGAGAGGAVSGGGAGGPAGKGHTGPLVGGHATVGGRIDKVAGKQGSNAVGQKVKRVLGSSIIARSASESSNLSVRSAGIRPQERRDLGIMLPPDTEKEREKREVHKGMRNYRNWSQQEIFVFNRLNMRGFEPLIPADWQPDFNSIPPSLFAFSDDLAFIRARSNRNNVHRPTFALHRLMMLGSRVRDQVRSLYTINGRTPESIVERSIQDYIDWAMNDAGLNNRKFIPILSMSRNHNREKVHHVVARVCRDMRINAERYRSEFLRNEHVSREDVLQSLQAAKTKRADDKTRQSTTIKEEHDEDNGEQTKKPPKPVKMHTYPLPTIFGIVISHTIVAVLTYDSGKPVFEARNLAIFDLGDHERDVWNAFGFAIIVVAVRNWLAELDTKVKTMTEEDDPDA